MFGLDARIALAIFGALSVISGAALYSAIQQSKVTAFITNLEELEKSIEQYYLDTGVIMRPSSGNPTMDLSVDELFMEPVGVNNWNGPYTQLERVSSGVMKLYDNDTITVPYRAVDNPGVACVDARCRIYIWFSKPDSLELYRAVETAVDGTQNPSAVSDFDGKIQYSTSSMFYQTDIIVPNPN
jgi:type II secretory pathway pseudopilin PulG